jgi:hypothetical protein
MDEPGQEQEASEEAAPELIAKYVFISVAESDLLELLREVSAGADPDVIYMEYFANGSICEMDACECADDCDGENCGCAWCALPDCDCEECLSEAEEDEVE